MIITKIDLFNCLQLPERIAFWQLLDWMSENGFVGIPVESIDSYFNVEITSGLKRRDAFLAQHSLIPWLCPDEEGEPIACYITTAPGAWIEWISLYNADELSFWATCTMVLFP